MKKIYLAFHTVMLGLFFVLCASPTAYAQDKEEDKKDEFVLEDVIVTAEKREAYVQDTAISITAVTGVVIREEGKVILDTLLREIPAVHIQKSPQGGQPYIRGVGSNGDADAVDPAVAVMFDGVYSGRAESLESSMYDLARVEVLRGPQGTLYGRNAIGGTVNVISQSPLDTFEVLANVNIGNFSLYHFDAAVNVPINDKLAFRVAALKEDRDGYFSNGGMESNLDGLRAKILFKPTKKISLLLTADYSRQKGLDNTTVSIPHEFIGPSPPLPPFFNWPVNAEDPWWVDEFHPPDKKKIEFDIYSLQLDIDLDWSLLTFIPAYTESYRFRASDLIMGNVFGSFPEGGAIGEEQYTGELRLASPAESNIDWVVGLYYLNTENKPTTQTGEQVNEGTNYITYNSGDVPTTSLAIFGQMTYPLTDRFRVTGGLRYTKDDKERDYGYRSYDGLYDSGLTNIDNSYSATTYKAGIEYDITEDSWVYAQIATGYKAGGHVLPAAIPTPYDEEELTAYEMGSKNRFLDNRLQVNGEIYYYDYDGYQVTGNWNAPLPVPEEHLACYPDCEEGELTEFTGWTANADKGKNYGGEIETRFLVTPNDEVNMNFVYTNATYGEVDVSMLNQMPGVIGDLVLSNQEVSNTPKYTGGLGYSHSWNFSNGGRLTARAQTKISSGYWASIEQWNEGAWQESYHKTDAYLTYNSPSDKWKLGFWVNNIENDAQTIFLYPFWRKMVTNPRTYGVNFTFRYR